MSRWKLALAAYALIAAVTFGHSAARQTLCDQTEPCAYGRPLFAAVFWPLYWSWEAWS